MAVRTSFGLVVAEGSIGANVILTVLPVRFGWEFVGL
jgi:hypothetical protein